MTINTSIVYPKDSEVRKGIAAVIDDALKAKYGTNPAMLYDRWVITTKAGETTARLRPMSGASEGKVHCWMVGIDSIKRDAPSYDSSGGAGRMRKVGANRRDILKSYRVWCFIGFEGGTSDVNSENKLTEEIEYVSNYFSKYPLLNFTESNRKIQGHAELEFPNIDTFQYGDTDVNVAQGILTIKFFQNVE